MPAPKPTNVRWLIVGLLMGLVFLAHFNRVSISVAGKAEFIGEGKLSEEEMGLVYSTFLLIYTIGMLPGGYIIDRVGPRRAMAVMGLGFGFCTILTGALGWLELSIAAMFVPLLLIRGLAGASSVPLHPGAARSVSLWLPLHERSTANGIITAGALVGIALTYPGFGWLMGQVGWQIAFAISGAALMLFALIWFALATDDAGSHRWTNNAEREHVAAGGIVPARTRATLSDIIRILGNRNLLLLTFSYGALGYFQYMFFYWIEYYFGKELKLPESDSRDSAFIITMAMAVGMFLGGGISDQLCRAIGVRRSRLVVALGGMGLCAVFGLIGVTMTHPQWIVVCFSLSFAALGVCEGNFWTTAPTLAPRNGGLACAVLNTGGNGIGMLAPILTPLLGRLYDWKTAMIVACVISAVGGLLWLGISLPVSDENERREP